VYASAVSSELGRRTEPAHSSARASDYRHSANGDVGLPMPAFLRTVTSATNRSDLGSIGSATEVASRSSDGSCELLSVTNDVEAEKPEPTEAGDVAILDVGERERPPVPPKADSNQTTKPNMLPEGSPLAVPVPPRTMLQTETSSMTSFPEDTADAALPAPARPAYTRSLQGFAWINKPRLTTCPPALAARAQPLLKLGAALPGGSSGSGSSPGRSDFGSPAKDLSPYAERPDPVRAGAKGAAAPVVRARGGGDHARTPDTEDNLYLKAAVAALAQSFAPPPRILRYWSSFSGALDVDFSRKPDPVTDSWRSCSIVPSQPALDEFNNGEFSVSADS
jgi:hypothetical protein